MFALASLGGCQRVPAQAGDSVRMQAASSAAVSPPSHCCTVVGIDTSSSVVTARESASGYTFRFTVRDSKQFSALKVADKVWADFAAKTVRLRENGDATCCAIMPGPMP